MIKMTGADFVAMEAAWNATGSQKAKLRRERIYRAGLAAGIERAAQACDTAERPKDTIGERWACQRCADAIRALLK